MIREIGRILVSLALLALAGFLLFLGVGAPEAAQALGFGTIGGLIIGSTLTYWLKPS